MRIKLLGWGSLVFLGLCARSRDGLAATAWKVAYVEQGTTNGFYDATPTTPIGGNSGSTLGEQRRIAFERAVGIWADVLSSSVAITVEVTMSVLPCESDGGVLGRAQASTAVALIPAGSTRRLVYPIALANALDGTDLEPVSTDNPSGAEVRAEFNSEVGKSTCIDATPFYLGLDGNFGENIDFLGIALHELGHGFGFSTFVDPDTGEQLLDDTTDAFSTHILDLDRQATWDQLTATERLSSFKNARRVVWDGTHVRQAAPRYLVRGSPRIRVDPVLPGLSGLLSEHDDGPKLSDQPATGPLVIPVPASGCERPSNVLEIRGAIVLVDPGSGCHPVEATFLMQELGASAVLAVDPTPVHPPMNIIGSLDGQRIPVVSIHRDDAVLLATQAVGRTVTLDGDATRLVGADSEGRIYLDATDPVLQATTISHWDALARNQLLMEPERSAGHLDVDVTRESLWDIGWTICGDGAIQGLEACDDGNASSGDGCSSVCRKEAPAVGGAGGTVGSGTTNTSPDSIASAGTGDDAATTGGDVSCSCGLIGLHRTSSPVLLLPALAWLMIRLRRVRPL